MLFILIGFGSVVLSLKVRLVNTVMVMTDITSSVFSSVVTFSASRAYIKTHPPKIKQTKSTRKKKGEFPFPKVLHLSWRPSIYTTHIDPGFRFGKSRADLQLKSAV